MHYFRKRRFSFSQKMYSFMLFTACTFSFVCTVAQGKLTPDQSPPIKIEGAMLDFALTFTKQLNDRTQAQENFFVSPLSIYGVLALLHLGAESVTKDELSKVLGFQGNDDDSIALYTELQNKFRSIITNDEHTQETSTAIAAGIFLQNELKIKPEYTERIKNDAGTVVENVDFQNSRTEATDTINKWISDKTRGHISQFFSSPVDAGTLILLATTLYFNGKWEEEFLLSNTEQGKFTTSAGDVDVTFMGDQRSIPYFKNDELQFEAISLAYRNRKFRYYVILPAQNSSVKALTEALTADEFRKLVQESEKNEVLVSLKMPKLKFDWQDDVSEVLRTLGLKMIFEDANLSRMLVQTVKVSQVIHATTIQVYELGTEATAATVVAMMACSNVDPPQAIEFVADRPFMFIIYDIDDETILFNGIVNKPDVQ